MRSILAVLPEDHPARIAYADGATTIELTHLVVDDNALCEALKQEIIARHGRILGRSGAYRP